jgi:hypothetical protein
MRKGYIVVAVLATAGIFAGCGSGPGKLDENYMKNAEQIGTERREIFGRANGNFDAMTSGDRKSYLDSFDGKEEDARRFWEMMANPPSSSTPSGLNSSSR